MKSSENIEPILRVWWYADAPREYRDSLPFPGPNGWVIHVPRGLPEDELLAVVTQNSIKGTITIVRLNDGSALMTGCSISEVLPLPIPGQPLSAASAGNAR